MDYLIGIDLGGTKTEILLLKDKEILFRKRNPTPRNDYDKIIQNIVNLVGEAQSLIPEKEDFSIGIGIPGILDTISETVINANTTTLIGKPLKKDLEELLQKQLFIENDANCFAYAETLAGATQNYSFVFGIIMGTGCGSGIIINKKIYHGKHGIAGEWGHFSIDPEGPQCWCGNKGCIETFISGGGIEKQYQALTHHYKTMDEIVKDARNGLPIAKSLFDKFLDNFGRAVGGIISILDPEAIVIGGGLSSIDELYTLGWEKVKQYAFHHNVQTPLLRNKLGDSAGVFGAAWLGKNEKVH